MLCFNGNIESGIVRPSNNAQDVNLEISTWRCSSIDRNDFDRCKVTLNFAPNISDDLSAHATTTSSQCISLV